MNPITANAMKELNEYRALGAVEELRAVMEKQRANKPIRIIVGTHNSTDGCPTCAREFYEREKFCPKCGQAIDWS